MDSGSKTELDPLTQAAHEAACRLRQEFYQDPHLGLWVATRYFLEKRGYCCQSGCRHCPYGEAKGAKSETSKKESKK
jgi:hypothetical protein